MSRSVRDLLVRGIAAAKANDKEEARFYLQWALRIDASRDQRTKALLWLSEISNDLEERRDLLKQILILDPHHPLARRGLAVLDGQLDPEDIIDPNQIPTTTPEPTQPVQAKRFVCPKCGGRMRFTPDGTILNCEYCGARKTLVEALEQESMIEEQDFIVALATTKGHTRPKAMRTLDCQGCGVTVTLPAKRLTSNCPYCNAVYVIEEVKVREIIPPEGVIPFSISRDEAKQQTLRWLDKARVEREHVRFSPPNGLYYPLWTFDIGGEIPWRCLEKVNDRWVPRSNVKFIHEDDVVVPANHALPAELIKSVIDFDWDGLKPYDPGFLADWPAQTYEIPVADASLAARSIALDKARLQITDQTFRPIKNLNLSSARVAVESFKLVLVPFWIVHYHYNQQQHLIVINGQTGKVKGESPPGRIGKFLGWLLGGDNGLR